MVQVIPSAADQLSPAIAAFSQGLEKYLKPNMEFQKSMQMAIGKNPELAQQLADLEKNAPGTMERMGFGELGHVIGGIPESAQSIFQRKNRGEIVETQQEGLKLKRTQTGFDLGRLNETINFLKDPANKAITADEILRRLTGQTADERTIQGAEAGVAGRKATAGARSAEAGATSAEAQARAAPARADAEIAQSGAVVAEATVNQKALTEALKASPNLSKIDFKRTARDFVAGKVDGATIASLFNTPGAKEALNAAIGVVRDEAQQALQERLATDKNPEEALNTREAFARYQATKGAGTLQAWKTILKDPQAIVNAREAAEKNPSELTDTERDILHAADAQDAMQKDIDTAKLRKINIDVTRSTGQLTAALKGGGSPEQVNTYLNMLNEALSQRNEVTGQAFTARVGDRPNVGEAEHTFWNHEGTGLYYVDEKGNRVHPDKILSDPVERKKDNVADAAEIYSKMQAMTGADQSRELDIMKKRDPRLYDAVSSMFARPRNKK